MSDDFRFAATYWCHYSKYVEYDSDLRSLVASQLRQSDYGELALGHFYEATETGWVRVDTTAIQAELEAAEDMDVQADMDRVQANPWLVTIHGPEDTPDLWSRHPSREEAEKAAEALPAILAATVTRRDP